MIAKPYDITTCFLADYSIMIPNSCTTCTSPRRAPSARCLSNVSGSLERTGHGHAKARTLLNVPTATTTMKINVDQVQAPWRAVVERCTVTYSIYSIIFWRRKCGSVP